MNQYGIALATDSAATYETPLGPKIQNTAVKLFMLSRHDPIGIMIYGSDGIQGIPFEIFIKEFQKTMTDPPLSTLKSYLDKFLDYFNQRKSLFTEEKFRGHLNNHCFVVIKKIYKFLIEMVGDGDDDYNNDDDDDESNLTRLNKIIENVETLKSKQVDIQDALNSQVKVIIDKYSEPLKNAKYLKGANKTLTDEIQKKFQDQIIKNIESKRPPFPFDFDDEIKNMIADLIILSLVKDGDSFQDLETGIVISGFGSDEIFPNAFNFRIRFYYKKLVYSNPKEFQVNASNPVVIESFAQSDTIRTFLAGISPEYMDYIKNLFHDSVFGLLTNISTKKTISSLKNSKAVVKLFEDVLKISENNFTSKLDILAKFYENSILANAMVCSKDELGKMAETLVNLTSFQRKYSVFSESVGGPTDVAVISKGDGFIWIKRKHYFDQKINVDYSRKINKL